METQRGAFKKKHVTHNPLKSGSEKGGHHRRSFFNFFKIFMSVDWGPTPEVFDYLRCCGLLGIDTLEKRRIMQDLKFCVRSVKNEVETQSFMHNFNFSVPHRATRQMEHFKPHGFRTEAGKLSVFNRLMSLFVQHLRS
jgi:hypothetical protein